MITKLTDVQEAKQIFAETLMAKTNKVTKISDNSVVSAISYGVAKLFQRALKDVALIETNLFPDSAFGSALDQIAENFGIAARFGASQSSTYVRVFADQGTQYLVGTHTFETSEGETFEPDANFTVGAQGFGYIKVRSVNTGSKTNVDPGSINVVDPIPAGHLNVVNEYRAIGGRDVESDNLFRIRIKEGPNILARGTVAAIEQAFLKFNQNVLNVRYQGINELGKTVLAIVTQNGIDLTEEELDELLIASQEFLCISDIKPFGTTEYGVELKNIEFQTIDLDFTVDISNSIDSATFRRNIQVKMSKYLDFRFFNPSKQKVEWDDLLQIVKSTEGALYVPDTQFFVNGGRVDITIDVNKLPRIRGFVLYDLDGNIVENLQGNISPVFYPNKNDISFQETVLATL